MSANCNLAPRALNPDVSREVALELLRHEYTEAANCLRHYSALRFAIMSVYVAVIGGLAAVALKLVDNTTTQAAKWGAVSAVLVTITFMFAEFLCERNKQHYFASLKSMEVPLGYHTITTHPRWTIVRARYVFAALYLCSLAFWGYTAVTMMQ